eukprot:TRINITY_DN105951_c0_g1_i1.p1 TRINITY_DN105951_c0_g1~~TRINITY_DN105951_c0_g1_i1.p1  ORF type:complete len:237 (-),score=33.69 TRINITY_DN105951_c0_g1_i1:223-933(-)
MRGFVSKCLAQFCGGAGLKPSLIGGSSASALASGYCQRAIATKNKMSVSVTTIDGMEINVDLSTEPETFTSFKDRVIQKMKDFNMNADSSRINLAVGDAMLTTDCDITKQGVVDGANVTVIFGERVFHIRQDFNKREHVCGMCCSTQLQVWPATREEYVMDHRSHSENTEIEKKGVGSTLADMFEKDFGSGFHPELLEMLRAADAYETFSSPMHMGSHSTIFCSGHMMRLASYAER